MRRGDIVTVVASGDYGKPRPAVVIQADWLTETDSVLICLMTSTQRDAPLFRYMIPATDETGLREISYVMTEKIFAIPRSKCGPVIGRLPRGATSALNRMLATVIGLGD